jgi:hypothetical protein
MRGLICSFGYWLLAVAPAVAGDLPDLGKLDRSIRKEPTYTTKQPYYGLLVFGPRADTRVWLVLDKSKADGAAFDVLYLDRNADGDLTASDKRLVGKTEEVNTHFSLPEFKDPATGGVHTDFRVRVTGEDKPTVMVSMKWSGKLKMGGGYPPDPDTYMQLTRNPKTAPIVWFQGDGPFRFQRWYGETLTIGGPDDANDFKVFLGQIGSGPSSFCALQEHVLPESEAVQATLIYTNQDGKERRVVCPLKERC